MPMSFPKSKMDSKTEAELRRQKILANAEARLRKIRRITLDEVEKESDGQTSKPSILSKESSEQTSKPSILLKDLKDNNNKENPKVPEILDDNRINKSISEAKTLTNGGLGNGLLNKFDNEQDVTLLNDKYNYGINSGVNLQSLQNVSRTHNLSQSKRQVCLDSIIFMILGILVRLLYSIGLSSIFNNNILGPFLVVCLPRVILYIKQKPELSLMYSVILLMGVKESTIKVPFRILSCLRTIVQSLALYLFSFFVTHCVLKELPL
ncbi:unnamed protein product [Nezara viridula]|uniref:Uncharacterized protein n=1 Tax=Nezara viridula TaxID=85310 RepID=A0A9P0HER6_NEZVI|nr:unnamed protein product [Nezara viridula]